MSDTEKTEREENKKADNSDDVFRVHIPVMLLVTVPVEIPAISQIGNDNDSTVEIDPTEHPELLVQAAQAAIDDPIWNDVVKRINTAGQFLKMYHCDKITVTATGYYGLQDLEEVVDQ